MNKSLSFNQLSYTQYKPNSTTLWCPSDREIAFNANIEKYPTNKSLLYYLENPIEYKFNNYGFRTPDDFNSKDDGNIFLGSSDTIGIGHHLENTWSFRLNQYVGGKFWNLSQGGVGMMTHFRVLLAFHKKLKAKNIFHFLPPEISNRTEAFILGKPTDIDETNYLEYYRDSVIWKCQEDYNLILYSNAIKNLAKEMGANYYFVYDSAKVNGESKLEARDLQHYSIERHDYVLDKFKNLYDTNTFGDTFNVSNLI